MGTVWGRALLLIPRNDGADHRGDPKIEITGFPDRTFGRL
jgi:hypothetical protein